MIFKNKFIALELAILTGVFALLITTQAQLTDEQTLTVIPYTTLTVTNNLTAGGIIEAEMGIDDQSLSGEPGINCGLNCSEAYEGGQTITLTAIENTGYDFIEWSGCVPVSGSRLQCTVTMDAATKEVTATFSPRAIAISSPPAGDTIVPSNWLTTFVRKFLDLLRILYEYMRSLFK